MSTPTCIKLHKSHLNRIQFYSWQFSWISGIFHLRNSQQSNPKSFKYPYLDYSLILAPRDFQNHINKLYILGQAYWMFWFSTPCLVVHLYFPFKILVLESTSPEVIYYRKFENASSSCPCQWIPTWPRSKPRHLQI